MGEIKLTGMTFQANHGVLPEERIKGNQFIVNISFNTDTANAERSDEIADTIDYSAIYELVKEEMAISSNLLEHVARRILDKTTSHFSGINNLSVEVIKNCPPIKGQVESVSVRLQQ